jgi:hypothetical protein
MRRRDFRIRLHVHSKNISSTRRCYLVLKSGSFLNTNSSACPVNGADCGWGDWAFWTGYTYTFNPKINNTTMIAYTDSKIL